MNSSERTQSNQFYTYIYYNPITTNPFYVGKGSNHRAWDHLTETLEETWNKEKVLEVQNIRSQGKEPIVKIMYCDFEQEAFDLEDELTHIWGLRCMGGLLTNMKYGGAGHGGWSGVKRSDEFKQKVSIGNRLAAQRPETFKRKSDALKGNTNGRHNKGIKKSPEHCKIISENAKARLSNPENHPMFGKHHSDESKKKMSESMTGRKLTEEHKQLLVEKRLGSHHSEETKSLMSDKAATNTWFIIFPDGHSEVVKNMGKFSKEYNISPWNIIKYGHTKGFSGYKIDSEGKRIF